MPAIRDEALCIRHWDWSETSQTVSLFTRTHGLVRGLAKGSRREKSNFSGGIELLTRGQALFILKPAADTFLSVTIRPAPSSSTRSTRSKCMRGR